MKSRNDHWANFRKTCLGSEAETIGETRDCLRLRVHEAGREGTLTVYLLMDGVYLAFSDLSLASLNGRPGRCERLLCIGFCREGRVELRTNSGDFYYMGAGDLRIDNSLRHEGTLYYPLGGCESVTAILLLPQAKQALAKELPALTVDLEALSDRYLRTEHPFLLRRNARVERIVEGFYQAPADCYLEWQRLKLMELLLFLGSLEGPAPAPQLVQFPAQQIERIRAVQQQIHRDLKTDYTEESLARRFGMDAKELAACFREVFGSSIPVYLRNCRMRRAAALLEQGSWPRIMDVAAEVGYDEQVRFSADFRAVYGVTPVQYRQQVREKGGADLSLT